MAGEGGGWVVELAQIWISPPSLLFSLQRKGVTGCWKEWIGRGNEWTRMEERGGKGKREEEIDICSGWRRMEERKRDWKRFNGRFKTRSPALSHSRSHTLTPGRGGQERQGRPSQGTGARPESAGTTGALGARGTYTTFTLHQARYTAYAVAVQGRGVHAGGVRRAEVPTEVPAPTLLCTGPFPPLAISKTTREGAMERNRAVYITNPTESFNVYNTATA